MIVTIDGPAGAGKSTVARGLAKRLGFEFLDTGAMYRAVAWAGKQAGIDLHDEMQMAALLTSFQLQMPAGRVIINGQDATDFIRTPEITALSRPVADSPVARRFLSQLQRQIAADRNLVTDGRDQGTVVFADAECKFFLIAEPVERARRRHGDLLARGQTVTLEEVLGSQRERDARDAARDIAPMKPAEDAITVDTSALTIAEVVDRLEGHVRQRLPQGTSL